MLSILFLPSDLFVLFLPLSQVLCFLGWSWPSDPSAEFIGAASVPFRTFSFFLVVVVVELGTDPRASAWAVSQPFFCFIILYFETGSHKVAGPGFEFQPFCLRSQSAGFRTCAATPCSDLFIPEGRTRAVTVNMCEMLQSNPVSFLLL